MALPWRSPRTWRSLWWTKMTTGRSSYRTCSRAASWRVPSQVSWVFRRSRCRLDMQLPPAPLLCSARLPGMPGESLCTAELTILNSSKGSSVRKQSPSHFPCQYGFDLQTLSQRHPHPPPPKIDLHTKLLGVCVLVVPFPFTVVNFA